MVPIFKCGKDRSKVVARPRFQTELLIFELRKHDACTAGLRETNLEALRRNVGVFLNMDIPGDSNTSPNDLPRWKYKRFFTTVEIQKSSGNFSVA
jgi:hypothetical protein